MRDMVKTAEILLVEDSRIDILLTEEALRSAQISNNLHVVQNGERAMDFLYTRGSFSTAPRPDLVILDLNLPLKDGRSVLAEIKKDPNLRQIPVVMMSSSQSREDIKSTYDLHVNCFVSKPVDADKFQDLIRTLSHFWLTVATRSADTD